MTRNDLSIYDTFADRWWDGSTRWVRTLQNMVPARLSYFERYTGGWADARVLDLGCAGGFLSEALAWEGAQVWGIDPSEGAIAAAQAHAAVEGLDITYQTGVGESLPFADNSFDHVVCVDVLEHVNSVPQTLAEVARVLRPNGRFLFDTINRNWLSKLAVITVAEDLLGLLPKGTHDPDLFIKPAELKAAMIAAGLTPGLITGLGPRGINRRGDLTFGRLPLTQIIYMGTALSDKPEV